MGVRRLVQGVVVAVVVLGLAGLVAQRWLGSADFKLRVESAASSAAGVPVTLGRVTLDVWPVPAVALEAIRIETQPAATIERVEARATYGPCCPGAWWSPACAWLVPTWHRRACLESKCTPSLYLMESKGSAVQSW